MPNQDAEKITRLVERHIRKLLPKTVKFKLDVHSQGNAWAAPFGYAPVFRGVAHEALEKGFGKRAVFIREGGSIPFVTQMHDTFKVPCILLGFGLPDEKCACARTNTSRSRIISAWIKAVAQFYEGLGNL